MPLAVDGHSNEIPALPTLIGMLDLKGAVVTVGAMGCQVAVAKAVLAAGADYVMTCKGNQPTMHEELAAFFEQAGRLPFAFVPHTDVSTFPGGACLTSHWQIGLRASQLERLAEG